MKKKAKKAQPEKISPANATADPISAREAIEITGHSRNDSDGIPDWETSDPTFEEPDDLPGTLNDVTSVFEKLLGPQYNKKDPRLWDDNATDVRLLSEAILGPIKQALRGQGWLQVNATAGEGSLSDEGMKGLFREDLEPLERALGRLVLEAIMSGDRKFVVYVDAALKDSDALFHRGTSEHGTMNERFFRWKREISEDELRTFTTAEVRRKFEKAYRTLNWDEWTALQQTFYQDFRRFSQPRRGRPPKASKGKI